MGWWIVGLVAVALTAGIVYAVWLVRARGEIPEETRVAIREAKQSRSECRRARKQHAKNVERARMRLQDLEEDEGPQARCGRWNNALRTLDLHTAGLWLSARR